MTSTQKTKETPKDTYTYIHKHTWSYIIIHTYNYLYIRSYNFIQSRLRSTSNQQEIIDMIRQDQWSSPLHSAPVKRCWAHGSRNAASRNLATAPTGEDTKTEASSFDRAESSMGLKIAQTHQISYISSSNMEPLSNTFYPYFKFGFVWK